MRVQSRILISQICVRDVVILVSEINCGAAAGCEQLHTTTKLSSRVELLSGSKHPMVEVKEAPAAGEKWFDPVEMHEVYLRTDRAASDAVGIGAVRHCEYAGRRPVLRGLRRKPNARRRVPSSR